MTADEKSANWQDWGLVGLRVVFLVLTGIILLASRAADGASLYATSSITLALAVGAVAIIIYAVVSLYPAAHPALPFILMIGDWVTVGLLVYASQGDPTLLLGITSVMAVSGMLRLGLAWGSALAVGVLIAALIGLGAALGFDQLGTALSVRLLPLEITAALAAAAAVGGYAANRQLKQQQKRLAEVESAQTAQLADMRDRTRAIADLATAMSRTLDYEKVLTATLGAGAVCLRESRKRGKEKLVSMVLLIRASDNQLYVASARGLTRQDFDVILPGRSGAVGQAMRQAEPAFATIAKRDPELQQFYSFQDIRSVLVIPLRAGFDNFGALVFGSDQPDAFTEDHTDLLMAVGVQATIALQNAVLYRNLIQERDRIIEADEEARKKLARDLHDGPTQTVAAIAMRMGIIARMLERTPQDVPAELKKVEELARRTTTEIRHMLFTLRPLVLENQGLTAALEQLAEKMKNTYEQNVSVHVGHGVEDVLDQHQQGTIFYIIEEAVNNARKHAEAPVIRVSLTQQDDLVMVKIADNGRGFDVEAMKKDYLKRKSSSLGMVNMSDRAKLVEGSLTLDSIPGKGTTITVLVPVKNHAQQDTRPYRRVTPDTTKLSEAVSRYSEDNNLY